MFIGTITRLTHPVLVLNVHWYQYQDYTFYTLVHSSTRLLVVALDEVYMCGSTTRSWSGQR